MAERLQNSLDSFNHFFGILHREFVEQKESVNGVKVEELALRAKVLRGFLSGFEDQEEDVAKIIEGTSLVKQIPKAIEQIREISDSLLAL